jgi:hypothetical protein
MLSQLDCASRYVPHSYFALSEGAAEQEYGLKQAIQKHGRPRADYVDRGPAYTARSLALICAELGIHLIHTKRRDCQAKGAIERFHERWRAEVGDELPCGPLTLEELNAIHWAWLAADYHELEHETTKRPPKEHFLSEVEHLRPVPPNKNLDEVFLHRAWREVRNDGTVRWQGGFLEVRPELTGTIELRFDPMDDGARPRVFVDDRFYCDTVPLDRLANDKRPRRRVSPGAHHELEPSGLDPIGDMLAEHYERVRFAGSEDDAHVRVALSR